MGHTEASCGVLSATLCAGGGGGGCGSGGWGSGRNSAEEAERGAAWPSAGGSTSGRRHRAGTAGPPEVGAGPGKGREAAAHPGGGGSAQPASKPGRYPTKKPVVPARSTENPPEEWRKAWVFPGKIDVGGSLIPSIRRPPKSLTPTLP